ncbi:DUF6571 family protein [Actinopolyspora mortivallis]|uniref:DUF6571 family protein n=1 Tax=Actinopolyspora mortivallis TaxID=33906 RepID=UPI00036AD144|nr:DUF6571 family protein [Actinopolyspora mortivallis]
MDYRTLKEASPASLSEAGKAWTSLVEEFDRIIAEFRSEVCDPLEEGEFWRGEAKELAAAHGLRIHRSMREYRDRIVPVGKALNTAAEELLDCQKQIEDVAGEINDRRDEGWRFDSDGTITYPDNQRSAYEAYVAEVEGILSRAAEADRQAARALAEADDTLEYLDRVLAEERREEERKAKEAAKLASQSPDELGFEEAGKLLRLLRENGGDPAFAGEFLERVRPKQLLELTDDLQSTIKGDWARQSQGSGTNSSELVSGLQRWLGETLATGTGPEGREYLGEDLHGPEEEESTEQRAQNYGRRLLKAAENWGGGFLGLGDEDAGYRSLGMLLHSGEYSSEFLNTVGDGLVEADRKDPFEPLRGTNLNHVDDRGRGGDPLVGLMTALEHSPEAASSFFDPARNDENLAHLVERDWPVDTYDHAEGPRHDSSPTEREKTLGLDLLGNALESATLGEQHGSAEGARSLAGLVHTLANREAGMEDPGQGTVPEPLRDNLGNMLSNYMNAVHDSGAPVVHSSESLGLDGDDPDWATGEAGRMSPLFSQYEVYKVMGSAAYDPEVYAQLRDANMAYTGLTLDDIAQDDSKSPEDRRLSMKKEANQAAAVFGALDEARAYAVDELYDGKDAAYNSKIEFGGSLASWSLIGAGAASGVVETVGAPLAAGGSVALADGATALADQLKQDSSNIVTRDTADLREEGHKDAHKLLQQSLWENRMWREGMGPPADLMPDEGGDGPSRLVDSNGDLPRDYDRWLGESNPYGFEGQTVQNTYDTGASIYANATGRRPVRVSETE